jgi:hypothetical protein
MADILLQTLNKGDIMFASREEQLKDLENAYQEFVKTINGLPKKAFLSPIGEWTPRDIAAHFIGWNRITLAGCSALREGAEPFYFHDGTNDYRKVNSRFFAQFPSQDQESLLTEMAITKDILMAYLKTISTDEWEKDTGVPHYRGDPATIARCVDSLIRDYRKHRQEIIDDTSV